MRILTSLIILLLTALPATAADSEWVKVSDDNKGFVLSESGKPFIPWGFNYDHEGDGKLIEDYWNEQWPTVESAFREMKGLGANVVRIHLQFGTLMESPTKPRQSSFDQLARLVKLAEETGLYLDLTGLGCYHKPDVPPWYDKLNEQDRWQAQAEFWEAVAKTCADSPAVFCYDLMNEPVVAGGEKKRDDWLGPGFGGKHFVQYITLDRAGRERPEIAQKWVHAMVKAIRKHDQRHLVTAGLVPWSLDRPGLTSGFVPEKVADDLDFIAVHIYPEKGKVDAAIETLKGFAAVGKPVVIEEIFPLKCDTKELGHFIDQSRKHATGWIGFYWGKTPDELRPAKTIPEAITLSWLELFQQKTPQILEQGAAVTFQRKNHSLQIAIGGQPIAEYIFQDEQIRRPFFRHLRTRSGAQVTRNHPPMKNHDLDDHPTMHPGLWLAFGDLGGSDFWRNKGRVKHVTFLEQPKGGTGKGSFTVRNIYEAEGRTICTEDCEIKIFVRPDGWLFDWTSTFQSEKADFTFGDQEEMGLGVRMATPLAVAKGGTIRDSEERKNGKQVWGKQADWCQYSGVLDGRQVGVVLMPHPKNFRRSWFHARDYGLLVANPFGQNAFTKGEKSGVTVKVGDKFRLRFGVLVYEGTSSEIDAAYRQYGEQ